MTAERNWMRGSENEIFDGLDPIEIVKRWYNEARESELNDPDAVALSTVDNNGLPNVRIVLMRLILDSGFAFFTNYESVKASEIFGNNKASFVYHWKTLRRQIRVRGIVFKEDSILADQYFEGRSLGSRYGAWASKQSQPLAEKSILHDQVENLKNELGDNPPRPKYWGGFKIIPLEIEFWADGKHRLHDRFRWEREGVEEDWKVTRLYP